jgi:histidinol phosphate phosphatase hisN-like protein
MVVMDVIGAHARRLPALDDRWTPRLHSREELERGLLEGAVAGVVSHPLDNVHEKVRLLLDGDRDKLFGLSSLSGALTFGDVLDLIAEASAAPIDHAAGFGPVRVAPKAVLDACEAMGDRLAAAAGRHSTVVIATGHPGGLDLLYRAVGELLVDAGATVLRPAEGASVTDPVWGRRWTLRYFSGVAMVTDRERPRHTHSPAAMERMLAEGSPDLVLADHGFAGAAIEAGVPTVSVADVNDPALLIAKAQGRTDVVVVMDDNVAPDAYWPCFQSVASRF